MDGPTVLVVDDNPDVLKLIRDSLAREGFSVLSTWSAESALDLLRSHRVAVVVLDLVLPGMGGMEFAWRLQELDPRPGVILISGYADGEAAVAALDSDSLTFLSKPFDAADLVTKVREQIALASDG